MAILTDIAVIPTPSPFIDPVMSSAKRTCTH